MTMMKIPRALMMRGRNEEAEDESGDHDDDVDGQDDDAAEDHE